MGKKDAAFGVWPARKSCSLEPKSTPAAPAPMSPRNTRRPIGEPASVTDSGYGAGGMPGARVTGEHRSLRDLADLLNSLRRVVRVDALDLQQLVARGLGDRRRVRIGRGESRLDALGHDA